MDSVPRQVTRPEWAKATLAVEDRVCVGFQALAEVANGNQQAPLECSMQGMVCKIYARVKLWEALSFGRSFRPFSGISYTFLKSLHQSMTLLLPKTQCRESRNSKV